MTEPSASATESATAVAATIPNASGSNRLIDWNVAVAAGLGGAVVAYLASDWLKKLSNQTLEVIFAVVMIAVGFQMLWKAWRS